MITKGLKYLLTFSLVYTFVLSSPALADPKRDLPRPSIEASESLIINWQVFNLTANQVQRMRLLNIEFQRTSINLKASIDLKQIEIEKLLISPVSDSDKIRALLREKIELESNLKMKALDNFLAKKSLLTTEQLAKFPKAVNLR